MLKEGRCRYVCDERTNEKGVTVITVTPEKRVKFSFLMEIAAEQK